MKRLLWKGIEHGEAVERGLAGWNGHHAPLPGRSGNQVRSSDRNRRVDAQAMKLIAERIATFGKDWRIGCAIKIPKDFKDPFEGQ